MVPLPSVFVVQAGRCRPRGVVAVLILGRRLRRDMVRHRGAEHEGELATINDEQYKSSTMSWYMGCRVDASEPAAKDDEKPARNLPAPPDTPDEPQCHHPAHQECYPDVPRSYTCRMPERPRRGSS
jgi:hypothetical protein